tara:strand:+ start:78 stop:515 length:438 start_codon:yes stop_codon:yes gene_type:complete
MRNPRVAPNTNQKTFLMIGGVIVIGAVVWWYMKKRREDQGKGAPPLNTIYPEILEGEFIPVAPTLSEDEISKQYVMRTWGLGENEAREVMDYVERTIKPNKDWVKSEVEAGEKKGSSPEESLLQASVWQLYYKDDAKYKGQRVMP